MTPVRRLLPLCLAGLILWSGSRAQAPEAGERVTLRRDPGLSAGVQRALARLPEGVRVGLLVRDLTTGELLEAREADLPLIPASNMKLVTAASVLLDRGGAGGWWSTELTLPAAEVGRASVSHLTLRGDADPTLTAVDGPNSLQALARQVHARGVREVGAVWVDESRLDAATWRGLALGVPMTAVRLAEWHDDPPASAAEARARVGAALIRELRRAGVRVRSDAVIPAPPFRPYTPPPRRDERGHLLPPDPFIPPEHRPEEGVASVRSGSPFGVLAATLRPSDNLRAEELLATLAVRPSGNGTLPGALARERGVLRRLDVDLTGIRLVDGSGLSRENRLTVRALVQLLKVMYDLPYPTGTPQAELPSRTYRDRRNAYAEALPQAGTGENVPAHDGRGGTLALRLRESGLDVRAKTGTLPGVSSLAGYVTGRSGHPLAFALLMNGPEDSPILTLRAIQDEVVRAVAAAH
nr:D-alanyl-D-alanine carboxypeptidase [Deinococcus geothermalis]